MKPSRAVILHGKPSRKIARQRGYDPGRANFLGWLDDKLVEKGVTTVVPRLNNSADPDFVGYKEKLTRLARFVDHLDGQAIIVAHSAAVGPVLEWALWRRYKGKVLAIAPWIDPNGRYPKMRAPEIDIGERRYPVSRDEFNEFGERVVLVSSSDDDPEALASFEVLMSAIPTCLPIELEGFGHFVTGNNLAPDYDLGNGLVGSSCPKILEIIRDL